MAVKSKCRHRECKERNKKLCAPGHENCVWFGCNNRLHSMARGPGGYIPSADERLLGNTD